MGDRRRFSSASSTSTSSASSSAAASPTTTVLAVECISGTSTADEWSCGSGAVRLLQTGDIVEEIRIDDLVLRSPFKKGTSGVQKILKTSYKNSKTSISVRVRRINGSGDQAELHACIVPGDKKQYVLRGIDDPHYVIRFLDRTETDCLDIQASQSTRIQQALNAAQVQDGYVSYPWEKRMLSTLDIPNSSTFLSILFLPKASTSNARAGASCYNNLEDTLARANAWLTASQASGVPITFSNVQIESLLTKISDERASSCVNTSSSLSDLTNLANASLYGFEDYHGVDIGLVRAVRLWYAPIRGEYRVIIDIQEEDSKLGFAISRTEEGFIYIQSVLQGDKSVPASRSGLSHLFKEATRTSKLLVISRINSQKILPWIVSQYGAIRCFDTVSLSQKLSLHRHAKISLLLHVFMWDHSPASYSPLSSLTSTTTASSGVGSTWFPSPVVENHYPTMSSPDQEPAFQSCPAGENEDNSSIEPPKLQRDTAGEASFRFHNFSLPNSWV